MPVMLWEPSNKLLSKSCGDCWAIRSEAEQCCFVSMQACGVLSVLCGATACFVARAWCLWCFENHQINCWANRAEIVEPFALRQSNVVLSACQACGVLSVLCGATACFVARAWCLWCFENHQINCWANRAEIVEPFALRQSNVGLVSMQCLECTVWGYCLFCCQSVMPVMLWEPSNKLLSKSCGDCWAIRSEAEQCCFVSMQACSVLSVLCGLLLVLLPERDACDALRTIK